MSTEQTGGAVVADVSIVPTRLTPPCGDPIPLGDAHLLPVPCQTAFLESLSAESSQQWGHIRSPAAAFTPSLLGF